VSAPDPCWFCDPYSYPREDYPNAETMIPYGCAGHVRTENRLWFGFVGLPPGQAVSWKRGVWA
jgi:hypothetical protein